MSRKRPDRDLQSGNNKSCIDVLFKIEFTLLYNCLFMVGNQLLFHLLEDPISHARRAVFSLVGRPVLKRN